MKFISIEPFIPSGKDFNRSKEFFVELGFSITWDGGDYVGYEANGCKFILQRYDSPDFAENLMLSVKVDNVEAFFQEVTGKGLQEKFGVRITKPVMQAYGKEVNVVDLAGVCWHFVE